MNRSKLPDFIFGRNPQIEREGGFALAGVLVTDIPRSRRPSKRDNKLVAKIIRELTAAAAEDPFLTEAGAWRNGRKPPDGASPPFEREAMQKRCASCVCIAVRVVGHDSRGEVKLDSQLLRRMGVGPDGRLVQ